MYVVSIDLSTKPGYAVFFNGKLQSSGTLFADKKTGDFGSYPYNYMYLAQHTVNKIMEQVIKPILHSDHRPLVVLEETTASSQNYSQKILEFIHLALLQVLRIYYIEVRYIRDGAWKRLVGATQSKEERNHNARLSRYKKKHNKVIGKLKDKEGKLKRARKLDAKDYALRALRDIYNLDFNREQEDECDAILIATAYLWGCPVADGTIDGGLMTDEIKAELRARQGFTDTSEECLCPEEATVPTACEKEELPG